MARGAPKLLEASGFCFFLRGAICRFNLGDDIHRSKQGDTTFEVFADLFTSIGESKLSALAQRVTRIAVMVFEDICGQLVGALTRQVNFVSGLRGLGGLALCNRLADLAQGSRMRALRHRKRSQDESTVQTRKDAEESARGSSLKRRFESGISSEHRVAFCFHSFPHSFVDQVFSVPRTQFAPVKLANLTLHSCAW